MLWSRFNAACTKYEIKLKYQGIALFAMALTILGQQFFYWQAIKKERTIIIPSTVMAQIEVSDIDASPQFIRVNLGYALSLLYSYTPTTAAQRFEEFLVAYVQPEKARELRELLLDRLRQIQSLKIAESIEVEDIVFEQRGALLVRSKLYRYALGHPISSEPLYLRVVYKINNGNLKVSSLVDLPVGEYSRLLRAQQLDSKKVDEQDKRRERQKAEEEKKTNREASQREKLEGIRQDETDPRNFRGEVDTNLSPQQ